MGKFDGHDLIDRLHVAVVVEVDGLVFGEAKVGQHGSMERTFHVDEAEEVDVSTGMAAGF